MDVTVPSLWLLYIIVVVIVLVIAWIIYALMKKNKGSVGLGTFLFIATLIAAIITYIASMSLNYSLLSQSDRTWLMILYIVMFILPVIFLIFMFWRGEHKSSMSCGQQENQMCGAVTKDKIKCDEDTGICRIEKREIHYDNGSSQKIKFGMYGDE